MVLLALASRAGATCSPANVTDLFPPDGAVVGPDTHVVAMFEPSGCGSPGFAVLDAAGQEATGTFTDEPFAVVFTPNPPLAEGSWTVTDFGGLTNAFTVARGATLDLAGKPTFDATFQKECGVLDGVDVTATLHFDAPGQGLLQLVVADHDGSDTTSVAAVDGDRDLEVSTFAPRLGAVCVHAQLVDEVGTRAWRTPDVCDTATCGPFGGSGGCDTGGHGTVGAAAVGLLASLALRRAGRAAASSRSAPVQPG